MTNTLKVWVIALIGCVIVGAVVVVLHLAVDGTIRYEHTDAAMHELHGDQCEKPGDGKLLAEFQNTLSNLAYLLFGIGALVRAMRSGVPMRDRAGALQFGLCLCFLAVCSGAYHATLNFKGAGPHPPRTEPLSPSSWPQDLDILGVYAVLLALLMLGFERVLAKELRQASFGSASTGMVLCGLLSVAAIGVIASSDGLMGGLILLTILAILALFVWGGHASARNPKTPAALHWVFAGMSTVAVFGIAACIKPVLGWDSTMVFAAMMCLLLAVLALNWGLSTQPLPTPELVLLGIVFFLGIVPRLLDGYDQEVTTLLRDCKEQVQRLVFRRDFCSPEGPLQAHAVWHLMSALALALTYDLIEKSRPVYASSPATLVLPQGPDLTEAMAQPILQQGPVEILVKVVVGAAAVVMLVLAIAEHERTMIGILLSGAATAMAASLWGWPLMVQGARALRRRCAG